MKSQTHCSRCTRKTLWRSAQKLLGLALGLIPAPAFAQLLADLPTPADQKRLEKPPEVVLMKESSLIEEVLHPELIFRISPQRSKIVRTRVPVTRIAITNPGFVDIVEYTASEFEMIGMQPGETTMTLWFKDDNGIERRLRYLIQVSENEGELQQLEFEYARMERRINELFPNSQVRLIPVGDKLLVRGQPRDTRESAEILSILGGGLGGGQGASGMGGMLNAGVTMRSSTSSRLPALQMINLMNIPGEQQILLKVRVADVTRSSLREAGFGFDFVANKWDLNIGTLAGGANIAAILSGGDYKLFMSAFASNGYGKILAEPTIVAMNGRTATFMAGGEFAVPTAVGVDGIGAVSTSFKGFGTMLSFTPTILDKDRVRLTVSPSFSSMAGGTINGSPVLNTRSVSTTVDLREGQWLALAGLIQDEQQGSRGRIPYIGDIPLVGGLFGSQSKKRDETELVVLVSTELIHPLEKEQVPLILPGMDVHEPTDAAFFFLQQYEGLPSAQHRSTRYSTWKQHVFLESWKGSHASRKSSHGFAAEQSFYVKGPSGLSE